MSMSSDDPIAKGTEDTNDENEPLLNKKTFRESGWKWLALLLSCLLLMGNEYCFDNPMPLQKEIQRDMDLCKKDIVTINYQEYENYFDCSDIKFNLLYTVYSVPNIVFPLIGGILVDRLGMKFSIMLFTCILTVGQTVVCLGITLKKLWLAYIGRCIFGMGCESLYVAQSAIVSQWFKGQELAFAMGINITFSRMGSVFNDLITPALYHATDSTNVPFWFGLGFCAFSLICGVFLIIMDQIRLKKDKANSEGIDDSEKVSLKDVKEFGCMFWLITGSCITVYISLFMFVGISSKYIQERFGFSNSLAGQLVAIPYFMAAALIPVIGVAVDRIGKLPLFLCASTFAFLFANLYLAFLPDCDPNTKTCGYSWASILGLVFFGFGYSTYGSAIWPSVPYVVPEHTVGTAFGLITSLQNGGLAIGPLCTGIIHDNTTYKHGYFWVSIFLAGAALLGLIFGICIVISDYRKGAPLMNAKKGKIPENKEREEEEAVLIGRRKSSVLAQLTGIE